MAGLDFNKVVIVVVIFSFGFGFVMIFSFGIVGIFSFRIILSLIIVSFRIVEVIFNYFVGLDEFFGMSGIIIGFLDKNIIIKVDSSCSFIIKIFVVILNLKHIINVYLVIVKVDKDKVAKDKVDKDKCIKDKIEVVETFINVFF